MILQVSAKMHISELFKDTGRSAAIICRYGLGRNSRTAVMLFATAAMAFGSLVGMPSLSYLQQKADLVVVGTASGDFQAGSGLFSLAVSRVIKGDTQLASGTLPVIWPNRAARTANSSGTRTAAGTGIWFLQASSGGWILLPVVSGDVTMDLTFFPGLSGAVLGAYAYDVSASLGQKLASEVCSATESLKGSYNLPLYALQYGEMDRLGDPVVATYYNRMAASSVAQQQMLGLSGLIRSGSGTALATATQAASLFEAYPRENGILLMSIRDQFRPEDTASIAVLGQTAVNSAITGAFREAAAHALAAVHTLYTLPYLATLLGDSNPNLQVEAVGGMGSFANGLAIQTATGVPSLTHLQLSNAAPYRTSATMSNLALGRQAIAPNEAASVSFWQQWWSQNRAALGF
jgi:hypothetical protein